MIKLTKAAATYYKNTFAGHLGFKNALEAICCLGSKTFNNQFEEYIIYEFSGTIKTDRKDLCASA